MGESRPVKRIDVIIPVYKPEKSFFALLEKLEKQTVPVNRIILMNTEQKYFDRLLYGSGFTERYSNISVTHLSKREFDHGRTRNRGVKKSDAEIFVMMTQDAMPADEYLIEYLTGPLEDEDTAVSYARQLPAEDSGEIERYTRQFNYPEESGVKSEKDVDALGIKTYFCSNVCAAYRRDVFDALGGFVQHTIFNEDMIFSAKAVKAGYRIAYTAKARVIHSHNYTGAQQLKRNFDLGVSQADHPEVFSGLPSEAEGVSLVRRTTSFLWNSGHKKLILRLYINSLCKYTGYLLGKHYRMLPRSLIMKCTSNRDYWRQDERFGN